jgi:hypothetical protein
MQTLKKPRPDPDQAPLSRWESAVISSWVVLVTSADLKAIVPYIHWYGTAVVILLLALTVRQPRWTGLRFGLLTGSLLPLSLCTVALASTTPGYELLEAGKLAILVLLVLPLLTTRLAIINAAQRGAAIAVCANAALALAGAVGHSALGALMAPGRFGTILNAPGSLWRVGILLLPGSTLRLFSGRARLRDVTVLAASLLLLVLDGSRTAYVILIAFGAALFGALVRNTAAEARRGRLLAVAARIGVMAAVLVVAPALLNVFFESGDAGFFQRGWEMAQAIGGAQNGGLQSVDRTRSDMIRDVLTAIREHPVLGTGMGRTTSLAANGPMVVHIAYLQVWADLRILGFLSFTALTIGSIPVLWIRYRARAVADSERRILFYNGIFLLVAWALAGFLHPISTEVSEWIMFLLGYSTVVIAGTAPRRARPVFSLRDLRLLPPQGAWPVRLAPSLALPANRRPQ